MSNNIITFPEKGSLFPKRGKVDQRRAGSAAWRARNEGTMRTFAFRSYSTIVESNEADLIRDVCLDMDRAESKLRRVKQRLHNVREEAAAQIELLTAADAKLTAAIVAALLSTASDRN
jgi:hypothetical protein